VNIRLVCNHGLGNRVTAIANALSFRPDTVQMGWAINKLCPIGWSEVFPDGLPRVEFFTPGPSALTSRLRGVPCESWHAAGDRAAAADGYRHVFQHMTGMPMHDPPAVAVCARFLTARHPDPERLASAIPKGQRVFILADHHRDFLARHVEDNGGQAVWPRCPELRAEQERSRAAMGLFLGDWKTMLSAELIVAGANPTSLLHPAQATGIEIQTV
jgi:hypothetical protein